MAPGSEAFVDVIAAPRGVYYYEVFAKDLADNYGPTAAANDRATNYWLGDLPPYVDGYVDASDVTVLAAAYGTADGDAEYNAEADIGPTDDHSGYGIPGTDDEVEFEDLMIISLTYDFVAPTPVNEGSAIAHLTWYQVGERRWALGLLEPCQDLKGIHLRSALPEGVSTEIEASLLLEQQDSPYLLLDASGMDIGLAMLGSEATIQGCGELFRVTLSADVTPGSPEVLCRSANNEDVEHVLEATAIPELPSSYRLAGNYPNPFNPKTTISFDLVDAQEVKLTVFDAEGRQVIMLLNESMPAGFHSAVWDGRDAAGQQVSSGVYFYRIEAGPLRETAKMLLLK